MSLMCNSPHVASRSDTASNEPSNVSNSTQITLGDSQANMDNKTAQNAGNSVIKGIADDKHVDIEGHQSIIEYIDDSNPTATTCTSSEASTVTSRSQSPVTSVEEDAVSEHVNQAKKDLNQEKRSGINSQHSTETVRVAGMDSVFSQDLPTLPSTVIRGPVRYVESMPGKKIRDRAANALNIWLQVNEEDLEQIRQVINRLHNASLILDDVEDGSSSRRGRPATHTVFGTPQAINSAGYQINRAMMEVLKLGNVQCVEIFAEEMDKLYIGQGYDLFWTFNIKRPSVEEYISMVDYKTGALFNMLVRLMTAKNQISSPITPDLNRLVVLLGRYFQIRDDYMNLTSTEYTDQKGFCDDLDEGKFSLTLIHALENAAEEEYSIVKHVLAQRHISNGMSLAQKHLILDILKQTGSLEYTVVSLRKISHEIEVEIDRIENVTSVENKPLRALFEVLKV